MPITQTIAALARSCVAVLARHIMCKTALVDINDCAALCLISFNSLAEGVPCGDVRLGMLQRFFIGDVHESQSMANAFLAHPKPLGTFRLIGVRIFPHITRQCDPVDLRRRFVTRTAWLKSVSPPHDRRPCQHKTVPQPRLL